MAIGKAMPKGPLATCLSFPSSGSTRIMGRKRVADSPAPSPSTPHSPVRALRMQRSIRFHMDDAISLLDSLPQDVLVKVLCKVNHRDLRQLLLVSKSVSEAVGTAFWGHSIMYYIFGVGHNTTLLRRIARMRRFGWQ